MRNKKENIILIGFMGSGKTSIGRQLEKLLPYKFLDTDTMIENNINKKISEIFEECGEEYFRGLETKLLRKLQMSSLRQSILSTGGGLPLREENAKLLRELGFIVYLKTTKETIVKRLEGDTTRPLLQGKDAPLKIKELLEKRDPLYVQAADYVIDTDHETLEALAKSICHMFKSVHNNE